jgi:hypothetical protein
VVQATDIEFRFHSMPTRLLDDRAGEPEDRLDLDVRYPRASAEKAFLDWLYLGESEYSKIAGPPLAVDQCGNVFVSVFSGDVSGQRTVRAVYARVSAVVQQ